MSLWVKPVTISTILSNILKMVDKKNGMKIALCTLLRLQFLYVPILSLTTKCNSGLFVPLLSLTTKCQSGQFLSTKFKKKEKCSETSWWVVKYLTKMSGMMTLSMKWHPISLRFSNKVTGRWFPFCRHSLHERTNYTNISVDNLALASRYEREKMIKDTRISNISDVYYLFGLIVKTNCPQV